MKSILSTAFLPAAAWLLITLFITGLAQADDKSHAPKEQDKSYKLKVTKAGTGDAIITSSPAGIDCGDTCRADFKANSNVTLTATAMSGSVFKSWGSACKGTDTTCTVTLKQAQNVTAITALLPITLNVTKTGSGAGTVTSIPAGIDCGSVCSAGYSPKLAAHADDLAKSRNKKQEQDDKDKDKDDDDNEDHEHTQKPAIVVTLTATPAIGSSFAGWSGACAGTAATCTVTMDQSQNVTAHFALIPMPLTVTQTGNGTGTLTGIDCASNCSGSYDWGTVITLTATPALGSSFDGWSGACTGTVATCTVTLDQAQTVSARFTLMPMPLTVTQTGRGSGGTVTSLQTGIDCGATCSANYDWGTAVTLAATPATGSIFNGWSGACTGTETTCTVTLNQAQTVVADFAPMPMALTIAKTGSGTGTISSAPAAIDCGATCSAHYDWATPVTLTATPAGDATFEGWSGACTGTVATCTVTMDQVQAVSADFAPAFKPLSLSKAGSGTGTITSSPAGIDCGATCSATFATNTSVTLTATPATGSTFQGWFGACTGSATTCTVTLSQAKTVNATFSAPAVTTYRYDANGNLTQITDPLGRIRQVQYDTLNQPIRQLEPHPSLIGSTLGQIDTAYDSLGQITSITDPRNLTTTYSTDSLGNLSQQTSPDTGVTTADHDPAGNLITRTDARGQTATYSYDSLNRINQIAYDDQTINYTWDICANGISRLCSLSNNNSNLSYRYDSHGRITQKNQSSGSTPLTVSHTYNSAGQRLQTTTPSGQMIDYQWTEGRLTAIVVNGQPLLTQISYEPDGPVNGWVWGNNQPNQRFYDQSGRPVMVSLGFDTLSQQPDSRTYGYDAAGRQTSAIDDTNPSLNQRFEYDPLDRLTSSERGESAQGRTDYRYDLSGNRSEKITDNSTLDSYSTDPASNRLQNQGGAQTVHYSYDPTGNLTGDGNVSHSYNAAGRRIASTNTAAGQTASYGYNALGQRITKTLDGNISQYFYDEQNHLVGEYDGSGQLIQEIVWLGDLPVAVLKPATSQAATADLYYIHADHLVTPRKITRPGDNKTVWSWESEAFGNSLPDQNPFGLGNFVFNLRFSGQYYDQETGLHYNYFRDYDPAKGRYVESDPIGLAGGINSYTYVRNNPMRYTDPLGLLTITLGRSISFAGGELTVGWAVSFPDPFTGGRWDAGPFGEVAINPSTINQETGQYDPTELSIFDLIFKSTWQVGAQGGSVCDLNGKGGEAGITIPITSIPGTNIPNPIGPTIGLNAISDENNNFSGISAESGTGGTGIHGYSTFGKASSVNEFISK